MRIAINGAGVAGPTLAYWLRESDHEVLLVEEAPHLRTGGYVIDFWGIGYDIAEKMGLIPRVRKMGYQVKEVCFVDRDGHKNGGFSVDVFNRLTHGRFTSLPRSDLATAICRALNGRVETIFGDSIAALTVEDNRVRLRFDHAPSRAVDLVIGADGLHSRVRHMTFGPESEFEVPLGYHVAAFEIEGYRPRDELIYLSHAAPGRQVSRFSMRGGRTLFLFIFSDEYMPAPTPSSSQERRAALKAAFANVGWECPRILAAMQDAQGFYFDRVSQIRMDRWTTGRVALIGDAAGCVSLLAGEGTGLAMAEAFVLAGELRACGDDHVAAFDRYQKRMMPFLRRKQRSAAKFASAFAPKSAAGITVRNLVTWLMRIPFAADWIIGRDLRDDIAIPDYGYQPTCHASRLPARASVSDPSIG